MRGGTPALAVSETRVVSALDRAVLLRLAGLVPLPPGTPVELHGGCCRLVVRRHVLVEEQQSAVLLLLADVAHDLHRPSTCGATAAGR